MKDKEMTANSNSFYITKIKNHLPGQDKDRGSCASLDNGKTYHYMRQ